jgi:tRNA pseudouridine38-40 synthase
VRNLRLTIAYDGSRYHGWQRQHGLVTVEGRLREVLSPITQTKVEMFVAGRTDAGVHAWGQVANFCTASQIEPERLRRAANGRLGPDILVRRIEEARPTFHASIDARAKHYRYRLWAHPDKPPYWLAPYCFHWYRSLDVEAVREAAQHLLGEHDFKSFETASKQPRLTTVRTICRLDVSRDGPRVRFDVVGNGFLYKMVRNVVGTLLEVDGGRRRPQELPGILEARDRAAAGATAPAHGLTLMRVFYAPRRPPPAGLQEQGWT